MPTKNFSALIIFIISSAPLRSLIRVISLKCEYQISNGMFEFFQLHLKRECAVRSASGGMAVSCHTRQIEAQDALSPFQQSAAEERMGGKMTNQHN